MALLGVETMSNGNIYEGKWELNEKHGQFVVTFADGRKELQTWHNGRKETAFFVQKSLLSSDLP
jgi:hypothetical protein